MTAPGGDRGEANPTPAQPDRDVPWVPPAGADSPPANPPSGHSAGYKAGYPGEYPPPMPPPGYEQPPAGYGPPPYPGGYYPTPDYPGGYGLQGSPGFPGAPYPAAQPGMNGLAIASLISSFAGVFCCLGSIAGIVLGTVALEQIKRTRQEGYGMAVAGIAIGVAGLVVTLVVVIFAMNSR
jgi:hypothetical protein